MSRQFDSDPDPDPDTDPDEQQPRETMRFGGTDPSLWTPAKPLA